MRQLGARASSIHLIMLCEKKNTLFFSSRARRVAAPVYDTRGLDCHILLPLTSPASGSKALSCGATAVIWEYSRGIVNSTLNPEILRHPHPRAGICNRKSEILRHPHRPPQGRDL